MTIIQQVAPRGSAAAPPRRLLRLLLLGALLPGAARALTNAEAAKWTAHIKNNLHQGAAASAAEQGGAPVQRKRPPPVPPYQYDSWWEGESLGEIDDSVATACARATPLPCLLYTSPSPRDS